MMDITEKQFESQVKPWLDIVNMADLALYYPEFGCKVGELVLDFLGNAVHPLIKAQYGQMTYLLYERFYHKFHNALCLLRGWFQGQSCPQYCLVSLHSESLHIGDIYRDLSDNEFFVLLGAFPYCGHDMHAVELSFEVSLDIFANKMDETHDIASFSRSLFRDGFPDIALHILISFGGLLLAYDSIIS